MFLYRFSIFCPNVQSPPSFVFCPLSFVLIPFQDRRQRTKDRGWRTEDKGQRRKTSDEPTLHRQPLGPHGRPARRGRMVGSPRRGDRQFRRAMWQGRPRPCCLRRCKAEAALPHLWRRSRGAAATERGPPAGGLNVSCPPGWSQVSGLMSARHHPLRQRRTPLG